MSDVPQSSEAILASARDRAAGLASQLSILEQDLQGVAARGADPFAVEGIKLIESAAAALRNLASSIDASAEPLE